jgi:arylsulfatase A-like enzyme
VTPRRLLSATRSFVALAALALGAACGDGPAPAPKEAPSYLGDGSIEGVAATSRPPIVLVDVAGVRYDAVVPAAGSEPAMPALARLLAESTSFDNAVSAAGWDVPALASLLTGLPTTEHQVVGVLGGTASELNDSWPTLPEILRAQGWRTAGFSRKGTNLQAFGLAQGFDAWDEAWTGGDAAGTERVTAWLDGAAGTPPPAAPPFLFLRPTLVMPASPASTDAPLDPATAREVYAKAARALDGELAGLLAAVRASKAARDAVVVVTAVHGYALGEGEGRVGPGNSTRDAVIRVPLSIAAKGLPRARVAGSCSLRDVAPTLLALVGLPAPASSGFSLEPLAARPSAAGLPAYAEDWAPLALKPPGIRRLHTLRTGKTKFVARLHVVSKSWDEQFFDLAADPGESSPLADLPADRLGADMTAAVTRLRDYLAGRVKHIGDVEKAGYFLSDD